MSIPSKRCLNVGIWMETDILFKWQFTGERAGGGSECVWDDLNITAKGDARYCHEQGKVSDYGYHEYYVMKGIN